MVEDFRAVGQNETSITLEWSKVDNISHYVLVFNGSETNFTGEDESDPVRYDVPSLHAAKEYEFTLYTVLNNVRSTGKNLLAVTGKTFRMFSYFKQAHLEPNGPV